MFYSICFTLTLVGIELIGSTFPLPTCVIIDTNLIDQNESSQLSSFNLQQIRLFNSSDLFQSTPIGSKSSSSQEKLPNNSTGRSCSFESLETLEKQMIVPFEFRRLHIEHGDHHRKVTDHDQHKSIPHLSMAVYERRSNPDGNRFCRTCLDGSWASMIVCEIVRCDAELLRATPRLVTQWGEVQPLDGGALYAPSTVLAVYTFAFQPHCKRCEQNGQWSPYALTEICADIKLFRPSTGSPGRRRDFLRKLRPLNISKKSF